MPDAGSEKETRGEKEGESRLGEVTVIAGELHQGPVGPKGRWSKKRKAEVVIRILRGEPLDTLSRELGVEIYRLEEWPARPWRPWRRPCSAGREIPCRSNSIKPCARSASWPWEASFCVSAVRPSESLRQRRPRR